MLFPDKAPEDYSVPDKFDDDNLIWNTCSPLPSNLTEYGAHATERKTSGAYHALSSRGIPPFNCHKIALFQLAIIAILLSLFAGPLWALDNGSIKVGFILPESGRFAKQAEALTAGFELYQKMHLANKLKLEIVKKDSGAEDENAPAALAELMSKGVQFVVCPPTIKGTEDALRARAGDKVVKFVTNPLAKLVGGELCGQNVFRLSPNTFQLSQPLAPWLIENIGANVFIVGSDTPEAAEVGDFFAHGFERAGGHFSDRLVTTGSHQLKDAVAAIGKSQAKIIFSALTEDEFRNFVKEAAKAGIKQPIFGPDWIGAGHKNSNSSGKHWGEVSVLTALKKMPELNSGLKQKIKKSPLLLESAVEGYELASIIVNAEKEKVDDNSITQIIRTSEVVGPRGKIMFDKNHERIFDMNIQRVAKNGSMDERKVVAELGPCASPDFGCGRIGFPKRLELEIKDDEPFWGEPGG